LRPLKLKPQNFLLLGSSLAAQLPLGGSAL
jgi:hypothetical protein